MTQKILAAKAGLDKVEAGQLILVNLDRVLGNDITSPVAIREFEKTQAAIDRKLYFEIFLGAEIDGRARFKNGNPCPSWRYDRKTELPGGFIKISDLDAGTKGLLKGPETN